MKLGALNAAIREAETVKVRFSFGHVAVQKSSLSAALKGSWTGKATETGLRITEDGFLTWETPR